MASTQPTDAELAILQVLWQRGTASVREVNDDLNEHRDRDNQIGYTTTLKLMQIMADKGLVERDTSSRTHIYRAAFRENEIQRNLLDRFVQTAFRGSAADLVLRALGSESTSPEELAEIKKLIAELEQKQNL
jgi:predicted transcriptional regulator